VLEIPKKQRGGWNWPADGDLELARWWRSGTWMAAFSTDILYWNTLVWAKCHYRYYQRRALPEVMLIMIITASISYSDCSNQPAWNILFKPSLAQSCLRSTGAGQPVGWFCDVSLVGSVQDSCEFPRVRLKLFSVYFCRCLRRPNWVLCANHSFLNYLQHDHIDQETNL
jgi:hypothetical protein